MPSECVPRATDEFKSKNPDDDNQTHFQSFSRNIAVHLSIGGPILQDAEGRRRRQNTLVNQMAPVSMLPNEILAMIFESANDLAPSEREMIITIPYPKIPYNLRLSQVTRRWRNVAVTTPRLWSRIQIFYLPVEFLELYLQRSGVLPLDLRADDFGAGLDHERVNSTFELLRPHAACIFHLWFRFCSIHVLYDILGHFNLLNGRFLKTLYTCVPGRDHRHILTLHDLLLVPCIVPIQNIISRIDFSSTLESLTIEKPHGNDILFITMAGNLPVGYPKLQSLTFINAIIPPDFCMRIADSFPNVTHFSVLGSTLTFGDITLQALGGTSSNPRLPNLKVLTVCGCRKKILFKLVMERIERGMPLEILRLSKPFLSDMDIHSVGWLKERVRVEEFELPPNVQFEM